MNNVCLDEKGGKDLFIFLKYRLNSLIKLIKKFISSHVLHHEGKMFNNNNNIWLQIMTCSCETNMVYKKKKKKFSVCGSGTLFHSPGFQRTHFNASPDVALKDGCDLIGCMLIKRQIV